jgi:hypothetical protein
LKNFFIKLFILCCVSIGFVLYSGGQAAIAISEISPDSNTIFLEHFNGSNSAEYSDGAINYVDSQPGLNKAGDISQGWLRFSFNGGDQWSYNYDPDGKEGTVEMWIYPMQNNGFNFFNINLYPATTTPSYGHILNLGFNSEGKIITFIKSSTISDPSLTPLPAGSTTIPLNKWTHVAFTWSDSGSALYVDGELDAFSPDNLYPAFYSTDYIFLPGWEARNMYIDEVLISRAARTGLNEGDSIPTVTDALLEGTSGSDGWYRSDVQVTLIATDNDGGSGVDKTKYSYDNANWNDYAGPFTVNTEGITSLYFYSVDIDGNSESTKNIDIKIDKTLPVISIITPQDNEVLPAGATLQFDANDTLSGVLINPVGHLANGSSAVVMSSGYQTNVSSAVDISSGYVPNAGVYTLEVEASDIAGNIVRELRSFIVSGSSGGFVTGGGWIDSPQGAYIPNTELTGKATFGLVSKYAKGAAVPTGNTQLELNLAGMNFKSTSYEWLEVAGARAQYKGFGMINGQGEYGFILTAIDGQVDGGGGVDKFRIKIWDMASDEIIYDSQAGAEDGAEPLTILGGGSIVIHKD